MMCDNVSLSFDGDSPTWYKNVEAFLNKFKSPNTKRAYTSAFERLEKWIADEHISGELLSAFEAQKYVGYLEIKGLAPASIRRDTAALKALYSFLLKESIVQYNPFDRVALPTEPCRIISTVFPTQEETDLILESVPQIEKAIITVITSRGLYSGTLTSLEKHDGYYTAFYRGKPLTENGLPGIILPLHAIELIKIAGLNEEQPFREFSSTAIERRVNNHVRKLYDDNLIKAPYSCLDFRHYFAFYHYSEHKDIYGLSKLLGHKALQTTQSYLWRLGLDA